MRVNWRKRVTVPVRDFKYSNAPIVFLVDVYGVEPRDLTTVGGPVGAQPMRKAVERLGLDPSRYQATIWDVPV